jgi:hypothetical protein
MGKLTSNVLWFTMAIACILFAITAIEFYVVTVNGSTATYAKVLAWCVSEEFAYGPESGFAQMTPHWRGMPHFNQMVLGIHAALCSVALVIGVFQFLPMTRARFPRWHRIGGRIYVATVLPAMVLSMIYLSITPMEKIYGGAPFAIGLWGIAILTTYTLIASWVHIMRGEVVAHQTTMVLNFSAMLIAPLLRFWWMCIGWVFLDYGVSQTTAHVAVLMFIGLQVVVGAIAVLHMRSSKLIGTTSTRIYAFQMACYQRLNTWVVAALLIAAGAALLLLSPVLNLWLGQQTLFFDIRNPVAWTRDLEVFTTHSVFFWGRALGLAGSLICAPLLFRQFYQENQRTPMYALMPFLLSVMAAVVCGFGLMAGYKMNGVGGVGAPVFWGALAMAALVFSGLMLHGITRKDWRAAREMTLHLYAICFAPALQVLLQALFLWAGFTYEHAFMSGAVLAPPVTLSFSFYYTVYSARTCTVDASNSSLSIPAPLRLTRASSAAGAGSHTVAALQQFPS